MDKLSAPALGGLVVLLAWVIVQGSRKRWTFGYQLVECEARCAKNILDTELRCNERVAAAERRESEMRAIVLGVMGGTEGIIEAIKSRKNPPKGIAP